MSKKLTQGRTLSSAVMWLVLLILWLGNTALAETRPLQAIQRELAEQDRKQAIAERIHAVGQVRVRAAAVVKVEPVSANTADTNSAPAATATPKVLAGSTTYDQYCAVCHVTGAGNAPKLTDKTNWQARIAQASARAGGFLAVVKSGKNLMPPMGTCTQCSDADLQAAIDYMLTQVRDA